MINEDPSENEFDFSTILENYDSDNEILRIEAANFISNYRDENIFDYLENLFLIITNQESSQHIKNIAIILSYKTFELMVSTNQFCTKFQYIEDNDPGLLIKFLNASISLFSIFPRDSGFLFSTIFIIINYNDENNNIIQALCERIIQENDLNFINAALTGLEDLCQLQLTPSQYFTILEIVFTYIDSPDDENIEFIKVKSLNIIQRLIPTIDEAFNDNETTGKILQSIQKSISNPATKSISYNCIGRIIENQFHIFNSIAAAIIPIAFEDLSNAMDENLIYSICNMLITITIEIDYYEDEQIVEEINKARIKILESCFSDLFYMLLPITFNVTSCDLDLFNDSNVGILALMTISRFIEAIPDFSFSILLEFFEKNFFETKNDQIPLEIFCFFISFIVTNCQIEKVHQFLIIYSNYIEKQNEIKIESFSEMIEQIALPFLNDPSSQVQITALNFLKSIIKRKELKKELDNTFVLYFVDNLFQLFKEGNSVTGHACYFLRKIIKLSKKLNGISEIDLVSLFLKLKDCIGLTDDNFFICSIFECIELIIELLEVEQFQEIFEPVMKIVFGSFQDSFLNRCQPDVLFMFQKYCKVAIEKSNRNQDQFNYEALFSPVFDDTYELFTSNFNETSNLELLNALTTLASVSPTNFEPHLTDFFNILATIAESFITSHNHEIIVNFVNLILFLNNYFDLKNFVEGLAELSLRLMKECISPQFNDISSFSDLLILHSIFIRNYFSEVSEKVIPLIELFSTIILQVQNIDDDCLKSTFIIRCSIVLKNIFEKANRDDAEKLLEISFELTKEIINVLDDENTYDNQFEEIIYLFSQMSNINPEPFQELSQTVEFTNFFSSLLQNENLNSTVSNFLASIGIMIGEQ